MLLIFFNTNKNGVINKNKIYMVNTYFVFGINIYGTDNRSFNPYLYDILFHLQIV